MNMPEDIFCRIQLDSSDEVAYYRTDRDEARFIKVGIPVTIEGLEEGRILTGEIASVKDYFTYPDPFPEKGILLINKRIGDRVKLPYFFQNTVGGLQIINFQNHDGGKEVIVPENLNGKKVVEIGTRAFYRSTYLKKIVIPEGVVKLGDAVFADCAELREITLPDQLSEIGVNCFENCKRLSAIRLPESLTQIPDRAFFQCTNLKKVYIPESVKNIGKDAFSGCWPVIFCSSFSYAADFAEKHGLNHVRTEYYSEFLQNESDPEFEQTEVPDDDIRTIHSIEISLSLKDKPKPETGTARKRTEDVYPDEPKDFLNPPEEPNTETVSRDKTKDLKNQIEVLDDSFAGFGLKVLQVGGIKYSENAVFECITFYVELQSASETKTSGRIELKINVYDDEDALLAMGSKSLDLDDFAGYDTVEIQVVHSSLHDKAAKARIYAVKA